jgi:hypothetical protein
MAFAYPTASCATSGAVLRLTLLPLHVPLLSEVQLPVLLQWHRRFLECLLQPPCQIYNRHSRHIE